jgi:predicted kinase
MKTYLKFINEGKVVNFNSENGNFIILMGGPGSGKSTVSKNLINLRNVKIFNVDSERELVADRLGLNLNIPEDNDKILKYTHSSTDIRNKTIKLLKLTLQNQKENELTNIVFDTVGTHVELIKDILLLAKSKGYTSTMIYVKCDIKTALERNDKRARKLSNDVVIDYHERVKKTFDVLFPYYDHAWIVAITQNTTTSKDEEI